MRTIGLIGGMSWESTALYYKLINEGVRDRLGSLRSGSIILWSFDFEPIKLLQQTGEWEEAGERLADAAVRLEAAGADVVVLCTNTMHKVAAAIEARLHIPFLHLADATAARIVHAGLRRVGLLGTRFTMEQDFYISRLRAHGLDVLTPLPDERDDVHRIIYDELCAGIVSASSREIYRRIVAGLAERGAEAVILGCTEITLLIGPQDVSIPTFDTTAIHAEAAVAFAVAGETFRPEQ
ncbi:MAG: aspartate/glutamate racemase family protein [Pseudochelatococcus sp.]|jgi:aspartate racemase|uniref:aspartate/glutamate racemase family protein n=1 Tax=Pseudochelatococcus sp. TaxID=2020869 RepID=UPI003D914B80